MGRPTTPLLDRERIAVAATELIRRDGDFTLPSLARRLKVRPASIYHHVSGREEIVELVREQVVAGIDTEPLLQLPWDEALVAWARSYRTAFAQHSSTIAAHATQTIREPTSLTMYERAVGCLTAAGCPSDEVMALITALESFVLGSALDAIAPEPMVVADGRFPALLEALDHAVTREPRADRAFEVGLAALVEGFRPIVGRYQTVT